MQEVIKRANDDILDGIEKHLLDNYEAKDCPLEHLFLKGVYIRSIFMESGRTVVSRIHNTTHPYFVNMGEVSVSIDGGGWLNIKAPYLGVTKAGTRRILKVETDCVWSTIHLLDFITGEENDWSDEEKEKLLVKIDSVIIEQHVNELLGGILKGNKVIKKLEHET